MHDQLNALAPGLSAPARHGRALALDTPTGRAVLACEAAFAGRAPDVRSLPARADGRLTDATAKFWADRWKQCLAPAPDADLRAARLARDLDPFDALRTDIVFVDGQLEALLADSTGRSSRACPESRPSGRPRSPRTPWRSAIADSASLTHQEFYSATGNLRIIYGRSLSAAAALICAALLIRSNTTLGTTVLGAGGLLAVAVVVRGLVTRTDANKLAGALMLAVAAPTIALWATAAIPYSYDNGGLVLVGSVIALGVAVLALARSAAHPPHPDSEGTGGG